MQSRILFLNDGSFNDAMAYAVLCIAGQTKHIPITVVDVASKRLHDEIANEFRANERTIFVASFRNYCSYLDSYEMEVCDCVYSTLHELCRRFNISTEIEFGLYGFLNSPQFHVPSFIANKLHFTIGIIDFGNLMAQKLIENPEWDIVRDEEIIDTVSPKRIDVIEELGAVINDG